MRIVVAVLVFMAAITAAILLISAAGARHGAGQETVSFTMRPIEPSPKGI